IDAKDVRARFIVLGNAGDISFAAAVGALGPAASGAFFARLLPIPALRAAHRFCAGAAAASHTGLPLADGTSHGTERVGDIDLRLLGLEFALERRFKAPDV